MHSIKVEIIFYVMLPLYALRRGGLREMLYFKDQKISSP